MSKIVTRKRRAFRTLGLEFLEQRELLAADPIISEFLARNDGGLRDGDGRSSDWIEIHNAGDAALDLTGYRLTDDAANLAKWVFPATAVDAGDYVVVFASGQDRDDYVDADGSLHTNFTLRRGGEYVALVAPDNTLVSQYGANGVDFPEQLTNVSYGVAQSFTLVDAHSDAWYQVPLDDRLGMSWTQPKFDAAAQGLTAGKAAIGMETRPGDRVNFVEHFETSVPDDIHAVQVRTTFDLNDSSAVTDLQLRLKYDNGFVAYLNGIKVAEENAPSALSWFSSATGGSRRDSQAIEFEAFDLKEDLDALIDGTNVLAIHALNYTVSDKGDLLLVPELIAGVSDALAAVGVPAEAGYISTPTPGRPNGSNADIVSGFVADTTFSLDRGFYDRPQQVEISTETPSAEIYFTTDGSVPAPTNPAATIYADPVPVTITTTLRAAAFKTDHLSTNVDTQTYIFLEDVIHQPAEIEGIPNQNYNVGGSATVQRDSEMDPEVVSDPLYRDEIVESLMAIPTLSIVSDPGDIWGSGGFYDGTGVEKPVSVEVIYADDPNGSHQAEAGIESHSHHRLKRSLRLNFRQQYGDSKWQTDLLQRGPLNGGTAVGEFDRIVLRGGNNRSWARSWNPDETAYTIDEFYRSSQIAMSGYGSRGTFVHLYINGVYWGLYNPIERPDSTFTSAYFGGEREDWFANRVGADLDGDDERYDYLTRTLVRRDLSEESNYAEVQEYVDLEGFIDYLMLSWWTSTSDWPQNNWYGGNRNATSELGSEPYRFFAWDGEWSWDAPHSSVSNRGHQAWVHPSFRQRATGNQNQPMVQLWQSLRQNQDFMTLFADRVYMHLFHDGALSDTGAQQRWMELNDFVREAIVAESARWGDSLESLRQPTRTRDVDWQREVDAILGLMDGNGDVFISALRNEGYYPETEPPEFNQHGGVVPSEFRLDMANPNGGGIVYFTTDGTDPRAQGGGVADTAVAFSQTVSLIENTTVKARVWRDSEWSALNQAEFLMASGLPLRVTEINFDPHDANPVPGLGEEDTANDRFEFIELRNVGNEAIDLAGVRLVEQTVSGDAQGVAFTFAAQSLAPGEHIVVVRDRSTFKSRYGTAVRIATGDDGSGGDPGEFGGKLANSGEQLTLVDADGQIIQRFRYGSDGQWPVRTAGRGSSLEIIDVSGSWSDPQNWRASDQFGGSPGAASQVSDRSVVLNEILAHPETGNADWVELRHTTSKAVNIGHWYLSNSVDNYFQTATPVSVSVPALGYHTIPQSELGFNLDGLRGDEVWLIEADASGKPLRFADHVVFDPSPRGVSVGSGPMQGDTWVSLATPTPGRPNSSLFVGDIVIGEVYYHAVDPDGDGILIADDFEFIELYNHTNSAVDLRDWQITGSIEFTFASEALIGPGETLLVVGFDPSEIGKSSIFQFLLSAHPDAALFGPYSPPLGDVSGQILLQRPNDPPTDDLGSTPLVWVDEVNYQAVSPWPAGADGSGDSLIRTSPQDFGDLPSSWTSSAPSPGTVQIIARLPGDADLDGDFDQLDIVSVLQAGKYLTDEPATWAEGDWTGDGLFDQDDIVAALVAGHWNP